jgi:hypothetical protein
MKNLFDLADRRITLVLCPTDLRGGYERLSLLASACLNIELTKKEDCIVFISKARTLCKVVYCDDAGTVLISRRLYRGRFQQLMAKVNTRPERVLTILELFEFLDWSVQLFWGKNSQKSNLSGAASLAPLNC